MDSKKPYIVLSQLKDAPLPTGLSASIMARIFSLRQREAFVRSIGLATLSTGAGVLLWNTANYVVSEASVSGFIEYMRLLVTDSDVALSMWSEFAAAMIRSAPLVPVALVCTTAILLTWSLSRLYQNIRAVAHHASTSLSHA